MKVLIIGDQHFKVELPYGTAFEDGRRAEWDSVIDMITTKARECDAVVLMGDNLNTRHNHSSVIKDFISFLKRFGDKEIHILVGNHEKYGESSALDFLEKIDHPLWNVYTKTKNEVAIAGKKATFCPFLTPQMVGATDNKEGATKAVKEMTGGDYLFLHQGVTGGKVHGTWVDLFNEIVLPTASLEKKYKKIFTGHIHTHQNVTENTMITGSIFTAEVGEHGKSVFVLDTDTDTITTIPLPVRGIYGVENPSIKTLDGIPKNSIVKCTLTKKDLDVGQITEKLSLFDAGLLVENYPRERKKVYFEKGGIDLSVDNLLKIFAENRGIQYNDIKEGFDIISRL